MTRVIAFDVNETLLDLSVLDASFEEVLGSAALRGQWFAQMLQLSFVGGLSGEYVDFTTAQHAALHMVAERNSLAVTRAEVTEIVNTMGSLPPHPEVAGAVARLRGTTLEVVALTNSVQSVAEQQLTNAGIRNYFDGVMSADVVKRLKPAPEPYRAVADAFDVDTADVLLVAAHSWDVSGAMAAGCKAAFVARPGMVVSPIGRQPDIVGADIADVVEQILASEVQRKSDS
jgi:2-haloacid dehalogenase